MDRLVKLALDVDPVLFTPGLYLLPTRPARPYAFTPFRQLRRVLDCPDIHFRSASFPEILLDSQRIFETP